MRSRLLGIAVGFGVAALFGFAASAAETNSGSKNFRTPVTVPNFFSNEAGPIVGGAAETRRGDLYPRQTATVPVPPTRSFTAAAAPHVRQHVALAEPRGRLVRGRREAPARLHQVALRRPSRGHVVEHSHVAARVVAHAGHITHAAHVVRPTRAAGKTPRIVAPHHPMRG